MKRLLFLIICLTCLISNVSAGGVVKLVSVTNKCSVISDNSVTIPVNIISTSDGILTSIVNEYTLGMVDNNRDTMIVRISNIEGDNISSLLIDTNRDSNNQSYINYSIIEDMNIKKLDKVMSFNLQIEFIDEIPDSYNVLGNKVILSEDEKVCQSINGYKVNTLEKIKYIDLNEVAHEDYVNKLILYIIIGILSIALIIVIIMLIRKKK